MKQQSVVNPFAGMQTQHTVQQQSGTFTQAPTVTKTIIEQPIHEIVTNLSLPRSVKSPQPMWRLSTLCVKRPKHHKRSLQENHP